MRDQALAIRIPHGVRWSMTPDYDGVTLSLHFSGDEDKKEIGEAFVGAALMLWKAATDDGEAAQPTTGTVA